MKKTLMLLLLFLMTINFCACSSDKTPVEDEQAQSETEGESVVSESICYKYPYANDRMVYIPLENGKIKQYSLDGTYRQTISLPADDANIDLDETELLWVGNDEIIWSAYGNGFKKTIFATPIRPAENGDELVKEKAKKLFKLGGEPGISGTSGGVLYEPCTVYADEDRLIFWDYGTFYVYDRKTGGAPAEISLAKDAYAEIPSSALSLCSEIMNDQLICHSGRTFGTISEDAYEFWSYNLSTGQTQSIDTKCFSSASYVADPVRNMVYYQVIDDQSIWQYDCGTGEKKELISEAQLKECYEKNQLTWDDAYYNDSLFVEGDQLYFIKNVDAPLVFSYSLSDSSITFKKALTEAILCSGYTSFDKGSRRLAILQNKLLLYWRNYDDDEDYYICIDIPTAAIQAVSEEKPEKIYFGMLGVWEEPGTTGTWEKLDLKLPAAKKVSDATLSIEDQLACISRCKDIWLDKEDDFMQYAVTDLDHNGRLEVIASSGPQGSGAFTTTYYYQVSADGTTLRRIKNEVGEIDIVDGIDTAYVDRETGTYYYCAYDYASAGAGARGVWYSGVVLKNGMLTDRLYATGECTWNKKKTEEKWHYTQYADGKKKKIAAKDFSKERLAEEFFDGFEKQSVHISWFGGKGKKKWDDEKILNKLTKSYEAFFQNDRDTDPAVVGVESAIERILGQKVEIIDYKTIHCSPDEEYYFAVTEHERRKKLLVIKRNKDGQIHLIANNENAVMQEDEGGIWGDPYDSMDVENNRFVLRFYGGSGSWRWRRIFYYNVAKEGVELSKFAYYYFSANVADESDENSILEMEDSHIRIIDFDNGTDINKSRKKNKVKVETKKIDQYHFSVGDYSINEFLEKYNS